MPDSIQTRRPKTSAYLKARVHRALRVAAALRGESVSAFIERAVEREIARDLDEAPPTPTSEAEASNEAP